ncbi:C4-dicarboxylate ABC transporter permease [Betaproteobacteria bacterium GR16-43]|nr:C4-dicarboxylate ABC transporter permease [Betaproteobacteria bacterium GR16-43]
MANPGETGAPSRAPQVLARLNAPLARYGAYASVAGLLVIVAIVAFQVFGRYVLNSSPTWTENLALVLILYVTLIGAAVGVRDAGHIGMDSILVLVPEHVRRWAEMVIHVLVALFGIAMIWNGWILGMSVAPYKLANINLSEGYRYVPLVISGAMIILFSIEHLVALIEGTEVEPAWH